MKSSQNLIIQNFKMSLGNLEHAQGVAQLCRSEPWNAKSHHKFINHAIRWAVEHPNTYELIAILLPISDQANDCRTLFKDACAHGRADIVRLLIDRVGGDILRHNDGHAILLAAKNGNPEVLQILKDKTVGVSLPIDLLFKKAVGVRGPALKSLDYLFPLFTTNIHNSLLCGAAGNNNLENLQFLVDKMSTNIKPSYRQTLSLNLKKAAQTVVAQGFEECLNLLIDTHNTWFEKDLDFISLATYALQHKQSAILLNLAQRSQDVQNIVVHASAHSNDECVQVVLAWMQNKRLNQEIQNTSGTYKFRKL